MSSADASPKTPFHYVRGHKPNVLLLDINMPGDLGALDAIPLALDASPQTRICVLTGETDPDLARPRDTFSPSVRRS